MTAITKSAPMPSDREVLTGLVERVTYQNAENGFCVLIDEAHRCRRRRNIKDKGNGTLPNELSGSPGLYGTRRHFGQEDRQGTEPTRYSGSGWRQVFAFAGRHDA
jgi:hypothetical protein